MLYEWAVKLSLHFSPDVLQKVLALFFRLTLPRSVAELIIPFRFNRRVFQASRSIVGGVRYSARLAQYGKPVLIVNGQWDLFFRPDERAYARCARAQKMILPGATHIAPLSRVNEFTEIVRQFARRVLPGAGTRPSGPLS
jgi:pimeloyl-ACP methyl ester carboxylesterase